MIANGYVLSPSGLADNFAGYSITSPVYQKVHSKCLVFQYRTSVPGRIAQVVLTAQIVSLGEQDNIIKQNFYNARRYQWQKAIMKIDDNVPFYIQLIVQPRPKIFSGEVAIDNIDMVSCEQGEYIHSVSSSKQLYCR